MKFNLLDQSVDISFLTPDIVDVFLGTGWDNWTRFDIKRIKGKVFLQKVNGKPVKAEEFKALCHILS